MQKKIKNKKNRNKVQKRIEFEKRDKNQEKIKKELKTSRKK